MDLFNPETDETTNLLPKDGTVNYYGKLFSREKANHYLNVLLNTIEWKNDQAIIFGKLILTKRKVAWYGDSGFEYTYSNTTKKALPWTKELLELNKSIFPVLIFGFHTMSARSETILSGFIFR